MKELLEKYSIKTLFSQNAKMKKSSGQGVHLYNWGIPAFLSASGKMTCPNATKCVVGCYAKSGAYLWSNVAKAYENRLALTENVSDFINVIVPSIDKLLKKHKDGTVLIRIHDSGDFYSQEYYEAWKTIARQFKNDNRVIFYSYTKMISMVKSDNALLDNFKIIYSFGGSEDYLIDVDKDRHSMVFENERELDAMGYINASENDLLAIDVNPKVGLVFHHAKSWDKNKLE